MKYSGSGGGEFIKFEKVGDGVEGKVASTYTDKNKYNGEVDVVIVIDTPGGVKKVRCSTKSVREAAAQVMADGGFRPGERIIVRFENVYESKNFKNNLGKGITIELPDRDAAPPALTAAPAGYAVDAYAELVKAKGEAVAKEIRKAVEGVAKNDPAKQAELMRKAVAA